MENKFNINEVKSLNAILFVLESLGGHCDFHKIFKILYFADQKHLALFGLPITGDNYIAMKDGPVPSRIYDIFKSLRGEITDSINLQTYNEVFKIDNRHIVSGKIKADIEELSESNIECLTASIEENKNLNFGQLSDKSHKSAWENAKYNEMDVIDIALEGGVNEEMVKYIRLNIENQTPISELWE